MMQHGINACISVIDVQRRCAEMGERPGDSYLALALVHTLKMLRNLRPAALMKGEPWYTAELTKVAEVFLPMPSALVDMATGHWITDDGAEMAREYLSKSRSDLAMHWLSDFELANAQYLVDRNHLDRISFQTAAKERIRWLSAQLAAALRQSRAPQPAQIPSTGLCPHCKRDVAKVTGKGCAIAGCPLGEDQ